MNRAALILVCSATACGSSAPLPPAELSRASATPTSSVVPALPPPQAAAIAAPSASVAPPATSVSADADAGAPTPGFEVSVTITDAGRGRAAIVSLEGKPVRSLRELTLQLQRIAAAHHGLRVFFIHSSYGLASEEIEATRQAVEKAGIHDITFGVIPLESPD